MFAKRMTSTIFVLRNGNTGGGCQLLGYWVMSNTLKMTPKIIIEI